MRLLMAGMMQQDDWVRRLMNRRTKQADPLRKVRRRHTRQRGCSLALLLQPSLLLLLLNKRTIPGRKADDHVAFVETMLLLWFPSKALPQAVLLFFPLDKRICILRVEECFAHRRRREKNDERRRGRIGQDSWRFSPCFLLIISNRYPALNEFTCR